jgi:hypothetical protein
MNIIEKWTPPVLFEDVLSDEIIEKLLYLEEHNSNKITYPGRSFGLDTSAAFNILKNVGIISLYLLDHPFKLSGGNFFRTEVPYRLHADTGTEPSTIQNLYRIIVIPLAFTIIPGKEYYPEFNRLSIMNQRWYDRAAFFMKGEPEFEIEKKQKEYNQPVTDYSNVFNIRQTPFPIERHEELYGHIKYENFEGMSELFVSRWKPKDIISFDRSNIHTSTNFKNKANVIQKIGLTFFTEYESTTF